MENVKVTFWYVVLMMLVVLSTFSLAWAANTKLSALTADATPGLDSLIYTVDAPGTTPVSRRSTIGQVLAAANDLDSSGDVADDSHNHVYSNMDAFTEAKLYTILSDVSNFIETADAAALTSLDTGEGANELFDMDQNVTTASSPTFAAVTVSAAATARAMFRDSDAPGSDKDMGWIQWSYVDGADGSENADKALEVGLDLADRYSAEVIILSVSSSVSKFTPWISFPSVSQSTLNAYLKEIEENQQKMLFSALKKAKETKPKIRTSTKLVDGKPADMIVKTAKEDEFDLIVIGSRGLSGIDEFLLGSVSDRVADKATCPVLIVK